MLASIRFALLLMTGAAAVFAHCVNAAEDAHERGPWQIAAGIGAMVRPDFPGSDSTEVLPLPAFNIAYGDRWFLNGDGLGAYLVNDGRWLLSASIAPDMTRREESDSPHLRGTGDVDRTAVANIRGGFRVGRVTATAAVATDIADQGHGTTVDLVVQSRTEVTPRLALNYGVGARWIDDEYATTFFGIDARQSARSGLSIYDIESGFGDARVFVNAIYQLAPRWILSTGATAARLQDDAADSPIVEDSDYFRFDAAVLYRF
jgi:outer membrane protein